MHRLYCSYLEDVFSFSRWKSGRFKFVCTKGIIFMTKLTQYHTSCKMFHFSRYTWLKTKSILEYVKKIAHLLNHYMKAVDHEFLWFRGMINNLEWRIREQFVNLKSLACSLWLFKKILRVVFCTWAKFGRPRNAVGTRAVDES